MPSAYFPNLNSGNRYIEEVSFYLQISEKNVSRYVNNVRRMGNVKTGILNRCFLPAFYMQGV
jgi:hypothetical protein